MIKVLTAGVFLCLFSFASCTGGSDNSQVVGTEREGSTTNVRTAEDGSFSQVIGREWRLYEVRTADGNDFSRQRLEDANMEEFFTLRFDSESVSGVAAPNSYSGHYTLGENQSISFGVMESTLAALLFEPEDLKEHEYYEFLSRATRWALSEGRLELHTYDAEGREAVLVFSAG